MQKVAKIKLKLLKIFWLSAISSLILVIIKYFIHEIGWEPIEQSSLHNGAISSVTFVLGFILSATIADYKESERMPAEFAANIEDMYDDAVAIHQNYPVFDLKGFKKQLIIITKGFDTYARKQSYDAREEISKLNAYFSAMEKGKVPPNFIVKLKQQQTVLLRIRHRVQYIQRIKFIPSAFILAFTMVGLVLVLLMLTNVDPFYGSLAIIGIISYVLIYMLLLIRVISTPYHEEGKTRDDVSLFLIDEAVTYMEKNK